MTEPMYQSALDALYEVAEVSSLGGIPTGVAVDALRLVNPALEADEAEGIVAANDARGRQILGKEDFQAAARTALDHLETSEKVHILRDLVLRMRITYRRRYLMYDAPPNHCAPVLLQNAHTVAMYRELFDVAAHGDDFISRHDLRTLAFEILPDFPTDACNIVKAALGDGERDLIGFEEFIMVLQPATSRRTLSEMVDIAKHRITGSSTGAVGYYEASRREAQQLGSSRDLPSSPQHQQRSGQDAAAGAMITSTWQSTSSITAAPSTNGTTPTRQQQLTTAIGNRPKQSVDQITAATSLHHELAQAKHHHEVAEETFRTILTGNQRLTAPSTMRSMMHREDQSGHVPTLQERELAQLRIENEELKHKLAVNESFARAQQSSSLLKASSPATGESRNTAPRSLASGNGDREDLVRHIRELETELRSCRAQLAVRTEAHQLMAMLKQHNTTQEGLRAYYHDESTLVSKHEYLRNISSTLTEDMNINSPFGLVVSQYDLIVCGYQALYRSFKASVESSKQQQLRQFNSYAAANSIVPKNVPTRHVTPSRAQSPAKALAAPLRWADLDAEVSADMKRTRTLRDPLLTDEERHQLRAKLATQMRGAARHYTPPRAGSRAASEASYHRGLPAAESHETNDSHELHGDEWLMQPDPGAATQMASHDAVSRLQSIASRALKTRRL